MFQYKNVEIVLSPFIDFQYIVNQRVNFVHERSCINVNSEQPIYNAFI